MEMLRISNVHVKTFRYAMERFNDEAEPEELSLVLINKRLKMVAFTIYLLLLK